VVLARVDVHGEDARADERVVEGVAAGARDDEDAVVGSEPQGLPVHRGVFPALVVDDVPAVDGLEEAAAEPRGRARRRSHAASGSHRRELPRPPWRCRGDRVTAA
jgi:hypothetical protein